MKLSRAMCAFCAGVCALGLLASTARATNFSWNTSSSGLFDDSGNWLQQIAFPPDTDNVPDANDVVTFRRGSGVTYTVTFPGTGINGLTPVDYVTDQLRVGNNAVSFLDATSLLPPRVPIPSTYTLDNSNTLDDPSPMPSSRGIVIGVTAADTAAVLTTRLAALNAAAATIGDVAGSNGTLNVSAGTTNITGSSATSHELIIGNYGDGTLNVNGGDVNVSGANGDVWLGRVSGSHGTANVTGANSSWTIGNALRLGIGGAATFNVTGGGQVSDAVAALAYDSGSTGSATVSGANSIWSNSGDLAVGYSGGGMLDISVGGQVTSATGHLGQSGITSAVTVDGTNSHWTISGDLYVGLDGTDNTLDVIGGGHVDDANGHVGLNNSSVKGMVTVDGANSAWINSGKLNVGEDGAGTLSITGGGVASSGNGDIAVNSGITGEVNVDGAGSELSCTANGFVSILYVGHGGDGALNVTAGGQALSANAYIGYSAGSNGVLTVDGVGSRWVSIGTGSVIVGYQGSGTLTVSNGGTVEVGSVVSIGSQGTVNGNGAIGGIGGNVSNAGVVAPGLSPGALYVSGNYTQAATGKLQIELAGTSPGTDYDQLLVNGAVTLDGELDVSLINSFTPQEGDGFNILDFASLTGTFVSLDLPALAGSLQWDTSQLYTSGILSVVLPGDYSGNGIVDAADYTVWRNSLGEMGTGLAADGDGNGTIGAGDYGIWKMHFGESASSGSSAELLAGTGSANAIVPEPATLVLLMFAAAGWCLRRHSRAFWVQ